MSETQTKTPPERGERSGEQSARDLVTDVRSTADAIEKGDWLDAGSGVLNVAMDIVGVAGDPLGAISSAGLGWVLGAVSFLREPFDKLLGSPQAITGSAQAWERAAGEITATAQRFREASKGETAAWQGRTADGYRTTSARQADGLSGLAEASRGLSKAMSGAGQALAQVRQVVLDLINQAVQKIIEICLEALSMSWLSFGSSIALGISQSVMQAVQTAQKLLTQIKNLVSTLKKVIDAVRQVVSTVKTIKQLVESIGSKAAEGGTQQLSTTQVQYREGIPDGTSPAGDHGQAQLHPLTAPAAPAEYDGPRSQNGWPADPPRSARTIPGTNVRVTVADGPAGDVLLHVLGQVHQRVENIDLRSSAGEADDWGYAHRDVRGASELSNHASATAVDMNATRHVLGARDTFTAAQTTEIHRILGEVDNVVRWGGDYHGRADEMHFEINGTQEDVARIAERLRTQR